MQLPIGSDKGRESCFELADTQALNEPTGFEYGTHSFRLLGTKRRPRNRDPARHLMPLQRLHVLTVLDEGADCS